MLEKEFLEEGFKLFEDKISETQIQTKKYEKDISAIVKIPLCQTNEKLFIHINQIFFQNNETYEITLKANIPNKFNDDWVDFSFYAIKDLDKRKLNFLISSLIAFWKQSCKTYELLEELEDR